MDANYLKDLEVHQFDDSMTISECGFETMAMAEHEWDAIQESVDFSYVSVFEAELLGIDEADSSATFGEKIKNLGKKIIELLKKIASYIMGVISKWIVALMQKVNKDAFAAKDHNRCLRGVEKLTKDGKTVKIYGLLVAKNYMPDYKTASASVLSQIEAKNYKKSYAAGTGDNVAKSNFKKEYCDIIRGNLVGTNSVESKDFAPAIREYMTGHKETAEYSFDSKKLADAVNIGINAINGGAKTQKEAAKKAYEEIKKQINGYIDDVKKNTVKANNNESLDEEMKKKSIEYLNFKGELFKSASSIMSTANGTCLNVLAADYRMNSQIVLRCYAAGGSEKKLKESTEEESVESIFGIDLI